MNAAMPDFPPRGSCDSHVHVIGPKARFPLAPAHRYTPMDAPAANLAAMLARLRLDRVMLVQPSFYGTDNSCMLNAMADLKGSRGVAVLSERVDEGTLAALHAQGIRGLRVNIATAGGAPIETVKERVGAAARLCAVHGWHVQLFVSSAALEPLAPWLTSLPVDSVFDHFGLIAPGSENGALRALLGLLESGKAWVKISGAYRIAEDPNDPRIDALARKLCAANPARIVWGSDWPHTPRHDIVREQGGAELPFQNIDTRGLLDLLPHWLKDSALVHRVLVENPARLYGFD